MTNAPSLHEAIPVVHEELHVGAVPVGFQKLPAGHVWTRYRFVGGPFRYTLDGTTTPVGTSTAPIGIPGYDGREDWWDRHEAVRFLIVRHDSASEGTVFATHYVQA